MTANKTTANAASVDDHIASRANAQQAADAHQLITLFSTLTGQPPTMWGPSIIGFGAYRFTYDSGRSGEAPLTGFAIRGRELCVYLDCEKDATALLPKLGKHRMGKSCLYFRRLAGIDVAILQQLVVRSIANVRRQFGAAAAAAQCLPPMLDA